MQNSNLYVQYGCGISSPKGWLNFDSSLNLRLEKFPLLGCFYVGRKQTQNGFVRERFPGNIEFGNIVQGLRLPDNSCKGIFASHVLEHLTLGDCRAALRNTFNYLETGGTIRLIVPDLKHC